MSSGRRSRTASVRRSLLAGVALAAVWSAAAQAQTEAQAAATATPPAETEQIYMEADLVVRDDKAKITTATGSVEVRYQDRTIRADEVVYEENASRITARGHVQLINADGTSEYADELVMDDQMKAGAATGFAARLQQNIKIAAGTAVRRDQMVQELNRAIYTPCEICVGTKPKTPTWSIQADRVVRDKRREIVYYRNAVVRVMGAPVLWVPVFWHADPAAKRKSGFLTPKISASDRRGFSYEQPYYIVTSRYSDLLLSPQYNSKVRPFLNGRARQAFYSGIVDARFGFTKDRDFDGQGNKFGDDTWRSYVLASGAFRINPEWRWGFTAERASDQLIFDKYDIGSVYQSRGPYLADDRRLISQIYTVRQDAHSYFSVAAMSIQGLRPDDNDRAFPIVAPLVEARWEPQSRIAGGRLRVRGSAVMLTREQSPNDLPGQRTAGIDSRRATAEADWRTAWTSSGGIRVEPFLNVRGDVYGLDDLLPGASGQRSRALAVGGADIAYPFWRRVRNATVVVEPVVQLAASPDAKHIVVGRTATGEPIYANEDSIAFEFDETNLMRPNKFPGYDLYEDGLRMNVAGRASVLWDDGRRASLLVGRTFRSKRNDIFSQRSGLRPKASDWVIAGDAEPMRGVSLFTRARLDSSTLSLHRAEAGANVASKWGAGYVRYLRDDLDVNGNRRENLDLGGELYLTKHWGLSTYGTRDLVQKAWVIRDVGVVYRDDCTRFEVIYRREDTVVGRLGPSESIMVRLTLATLGEPLYTR